jgi:hypothetical protein
VTAGDNRPTAMRWGHLPLAGASRAHDPPATMQSAAMRRSGAHDPPATMQSAAMRSGAHDPPATMQSAAMRRSGAHD